MSAAIFKNNVDVSGNLDVSGDLTFRDNLYHNGEALTINMKSFLQTYISGKTLFEDLFKVTFETDTLIEITDSDSTGFGEDSPRALRSDETNYPYDNNTIIIKYKINDYPNDASSAVLYKIGGDDYGLVIGFSEKNRLVVYGGRATPLNSVVDGLTAGTEQNTNLFGVNAGFDISDCENETNIIGLDISFSQGTSNTIADFKLYFNNNLISENSGHDLSNKGLWDSNRATFGNIGMQDNYNKLFEGTPENITTLDLEVGSFAGLISGSVYEEYPFFSDNANIISSNFIVGGEIIVGDYSTEGINVKKKFSEIDTSINSFTVSGSSSTNTTTDTSVNIIETNLEELESALDDKQDTITSSTDISCGNLDVSGDLVVSGDLTVSGLNISETLTGKQDTLTHNDNAGTNISISEGVISATNTDTTYTAATHGGLTLSGTEFSLDFSNTNATVEIPQDVHIEKDGYPQLIIEPAADDDKDAKIEIRGARSNSTIKYPSALLLSNYDSDTSTTSYMGQIAGRVENTTDNVGGLYFHHYSHGVIGTGATMNYNGNWRFGSGDFQNNYKVQIDGNTQIDGTLGIAGNLDLSGTLNIYSNLKIYNDRNIQAESDNSKIKVNKFKMTEFNSDSKFIFENQHGAEKFTIDGSGNVDISGTLNVNGFSYREPQMAIFAFDQTSLLDGSDSEVLSVGSKFGNDSYFSHPGLVRLKGDDFITSYTDGAIKIGKNGFYRIRVGGNPMLINNFSSRVSLCLYLEIGNNSYLQDPSYNFFGHCYLRGTSGSMVGAFGNINFEDYIEISGETTLYVRNRVTYDSDFYAAVLDVDKLKCCCNLQIERISE